MDDVPPTPTWTDVDPPRPLTPREQGLVDVLVAAARLPALRRQASALLADGTCACGCSSIRLTTSAGPVDATDLVRLGSADDGFHLGIEASAGRGRTACHLELHVLEGRLHELEVHAGDGVVVPLPQPRHLRDVRLGP